MEKEIKETAVVVGFTLVRNSKAQNSEAVSLTRRPFGIRPIDQFRLQPLNRFNIRIAVNWIKESFKSRNYFFVLFTFSDEQPKAIESYVQVNQTETNNNQVPGDVNRCGCLPSVQ